MKPARLHRSHQRLSQYCRRDVISPNPTVQPRYHRKSQIITKGRAPQKTIPNAVCQSQLSTSPVCPGCLAAHNCQSSSALVPPTSPTSPPHPTEVSAPGLLECWVRQVYVTEISAVHTSFTGLPFFYTLPTSCR